MQDVMDNIRIHIEAGDPYQCVNELLEVATEQTANLLQLWAETKGYCELSQDDAFGRGFAELAEWANPKTDALFCIDDVVLVVQSREHLRKYNEEIEREIHG